MTLPRLHVVTDDAVLARQGFLSEADAVLEAGGSRVALHVRGPSTNGRRLFDVVTELASSAERRGARLFVNDRVDVALAADVGNVHLGARSLPPSTVRSLMGDDSVIGVSCRGADGVSEGVEEGADYVFVGTLFRTPSHPDREPRGVQGLSSAVTVADTVPVVAIGGVDAGNASVVAEAGAYGAAVIRAVWDAEDQAAAVVRLLESLGDTPA